jgi:hypothetical protein
MRVRSILTKTANGASIEEVPEVAELDEMFFRLYDLSAVESARLLGA